MKLNFIKLIVIENVVFWLRVGILLSILYCVIFVFGIYVIFM